MMSHIITGKHKTRYEIPEEITAISQIKVIKPDGKVFFMPVDDFEKIVMAIDGIKLLDKALGKNLRIMFA